MKTDATILGTILGPALLCALAGPSLAQGPADARMGHEARASEASATVELVDPVGLEWNARAAEHLLNRAGFGARPEEIAEAVAAGPARTVARLLAVRPERDPFFVERNAPDYRAMRSMTKEEQDKLKRDVRQAERRQVEGYVSWWYRRLLESENPLQERMVLFWHGFFTSSPMGVRRSYELLRQNQLARENALGSYAKLLRGMVRDPAMLMYLDNHVNKKESPNENFARELMELFSLGEGNYSEHDVKEAARALTGRMGDGDGQFVFRKRLHDEGEKTILDVTGKLDGEDLVDILLAQDACPRWVTRRLLAYFEGVDPSPERLERYARLLREHDYEVAPVLRALFLDPEFYRPEIVGARFASPIDYLVGTSRRLGIEPPGMLLHAAASTLGQKLLNPPNVKGWEEGSAWISTATLIARGNYAGLMLGVIEPADVLADEDLLRAELAMQAGSDSMNGSMDPSMDGGMDEGEGYVGEGDSMDPSMDAANDRRGAPRGKPAAMPPELRAWTRGASSTWRSGLNLSARVKRARASTDAQVVDVLLTELLAIEAGPATRETVLDYFRALRAELGIAEGRWRAEPEAFEALLRRTAHLVLSLPEAQLS